MWTNLCKILPSVCMTLCTTAIIMFDFTLGYILSSNHFQFIIPNLIGFEKVHMQIKSNEQIRKQKQNINKQVSLTIVAILAAVWLRKMPSIFPWAIKLRFSLWPFKSNCLISSVIEINVAFSHAEPNFFEIELRNDYTKKNGW